MFLRASIFLSLFVLTGCDEPLTFTQVCKETPGLCNDLNINDSHCKEQRADVIVARYHEYKQPTDKNKYILLKGFEKYDHCVASAAKIEQIKSKEKTTSRVNGHLTSLKEITRLYQDTKNTNHPGLLYYHWSRKNDQTALTKLLALENDPSVANDAEMQFFLASYYIKFDEEKTIDLLFRTLELNKPNHILNPEIYTTLVSLFYKHEKYKHAYMFAKVAQLSGITNIQISPIAQKLTSEGKELSDLDTLAQKTYDSIESGQFVPPDKL